MALASSKVVAVPCFGAGSPASARTRPKAPRSSAAWIASGEVPTIGTPLSLSACDRPSGVWPPSWTMTPAVGGVVVGGDRLRVAVDHHGLVAGVAQREGGVDAGVVELDALADAVGART